MASGRRRTPCFACFGAPEKEKSQWTVEDAALHAAAALGDVSGLTAALDSGADVNRRDQRGATALHVLLTSSDGNPCFSTALHLLVHYGAHTDAGDSTGQTALHLAAAGDRLHLLEILLDSGASTHARTVDGRTPLHHACEHASEPLVRALLCAGAAVDAQSSSGLTPLVLASTRAQGGPPIQGLLTFWQADTHRAAFITASLRGHRYSAMLGGSRTGSRHYEGSARGESLRAQSAGLKPSIGVPHGSMDDLQALAMGQHGSCAALNALVAAA